MMMAAQVQPRLHRRQHVVNRRLPRVAPDWLPSLTRLVDDDKWTRGLMRHQDVDAAHPLARLHLFAYEMPPFIIAPFGRQLRGRRLEPCRRVRAAESGDGQRANR